MTQAEAGKGDKRIPESERGNFDENHEIIFGKRCIKHVSQIEPCPVCDGWTPNGANVPAKAHFERFNGLWYWKLLDAPPSRAVVGTWKCECGDRVPESYPECPICEFKKESK